MSLKLNPYAQSNVLQKYGNLCLPSKEQINGFINNARASARCGWCSRNVSGTLSCFVANLCQRSGTADRHAAIKQWIIKKPHFSKLKCEWFFYLTYFARYCPCQQCSDLYSRSLQSLGYLLKCVRDSLMPFRIPNSMRSVNVPNCRFVEEKPSRGWFHIVKNVWESSMWPPVRIHRRWSSAWWDAMLVTDNYLQRRSYCGNHTTGLTAMLFCLNGKKWKMSNFIQKFIQSCLIFIAWAIHSEHWSCFTLTHWNYFDSNTNHRQIDSVQMTDSVDVPLRAFGCMNCP